MSVAFAVDYGDKDPEDAWDDVDATAVKLALLERAVDSIAEDVSARSGRARGRLRDALRLTDKLNIDLRRLRDRQRLRRIVEALEDLQEQLDG